MINVPALFATMVSMGVTALALASLIHVRDGMPTDIPNARSLHSLPVPRVGGIAMILGCLAASFVCPWPSAEIGKSLGLALLLAGLSLADDYRALPVGLRLTAHILVASAASMVVVFPDQAPIQALILSVLAIAWMANLFNFMDGSNGLAGGMALIGFIALGLAAGPSSSIGIASWVIAGASLAFLAYNFPIARAFMGDAGSVPLGFLSASFGLTGWQAGMWPLWFPILIFSPFIFDASLTLTRRALARERVWVAHHDHGYQHLIRSGWSHEKTAMAAWCLMIGGSGLAFALLHVSALAQIAGLGAWFAVLCGLFTAIEVRWRRFRCEHP